MASSKSSRKIRSLLDYTNQVLRIDSDDAFDVCPQTPFLSQLLHNLFWRGLDPVLTDIAAHKNARRALLRILSLKKPSRRTRQERALQYVLDNHELFLGWTDLLVAAQSRPCIFQLDRNKAWWAPGKLRLVQQTRLELESKFQNEDLEQALESHGFLLLDQESYRRRIKIDLMGMLAQGSSEILTHACEVITLFTSPRAKLSEDEELGFVIPEEERNQLKFDIFESWYNQHRPQLISVPHRSLSTMPMESGHLGLMAAGQSSSDSGMRFYEEPGGQLSLLVYHKKLILKGDQAPDTYISIPLPGTTTQDYGGLELTALLQALPGLDSMTPRQRTNYMKDIPRLISGMFLAARQDFSYQDALGLGPGEFLDTTSARRLTHLIGLDESRSRYRKRVQSVRSWLERLSLEREIVVDRHGKRQRIRHSGAIVQQLQDTYEVIDECPDILKSKHDQKLLAWRIHRDLWRMTDPEGGAAAFMLLDQRAFRLDETLAQHTSEPFNLYWTIVQRAYNAARSTNIADKVHDGGIFHPRAKILYDLAGLGHESDRNNPSMIRDRFRTYLSLMVDYGLLLDWSSTLLENDSRSFDSHAFEDERLTLTLPGDLVHYLPARAFHQVEESPELPAETTSP